MDAASRKNHSEATDFGNRGRRSWTAGGTPIPRVNNPSQKLIDGEATRLIADEFSVGLAGAKILVERKTWAPDEEKFLLDAWQRDKAILANELSDRDWNSVRIAARAVQDFRWVHAALRSGVDATDAMADKGKPIVRDIEAGLEVLAPYVRGPRATR